MNDQIKNIVTHVLTGFGMFLVGRGLVTTDMVTALVPALVTILGVAYSAYLNTDTNKIATVAALDKVEVVSVNDPELARAANAAAGDAGTVKAV